MTKELKDKLEEVGVEFSGRTHIAKNGNFYKVARPTDQFWSLYKKEKENLNKEGISVYKHEKYGFVVYDWSNKNKATQEEIEQYHKEEEDYNNTLDERRLDTILSVLNGYNEHSDYDLDKLTTLDKAINFIDEECSSSDYMWEEIRANGYPESFFWS